MAIITSIQQAKKRESRVNIFLDGEFWLGLDKNDLLNLGLYKGKEVPDVRKKEIEKTAQFSKLLEKAINYTLIRPRSELEMKIYLTRKQKLAEDESEGIINRLKEKGYLDNKKFTEWFVENRLNFGTHGENKIKAELAKKGIDRKLVESIFREKFSTEEFKISEDSKIQEYIKKNLPKIKAENEYERKQKMIAKLLSRGYKYSDIQKQLKSDSRGDF